MVPTYTEDAKKRILQAASEQFKEKGYFLSSMDDIARRLGISKGAIYRYFDSKESILASLYSNAPDNLRSLFSDASADPIAAAKEVFEKMATKQNANLFVDFIAEAATNVSLQGIMQENIGRFTEALESVLLKKNPTLSRKDIEKMHDSLVVLGLVFNGLNCWIAIGVPESDARKIWARTVDILLEPIVKRRKTPESRDTIRQ